MITPTEILSNLPYEEPFLFVDELTHVDEEGAEGAYTFKEDAFFYRGHFKGYPVTPGVILTECMAQIGVVCLGIYLIDGLKPKDRVALTENNMQFHRPVFPGEKVTVKSEKEYFRFGKLKCKVSMFNAEGELVCKGIISGMIIKHKPTEKE